VLLFDAKAGDKGCQRGTKTGARGNPWVATVQRRPVRAAWSASHLAHVGLAGLFCCRIATYNNLEVLDHTWSPHFVPFLFEDNGSPIMVLDTWPKRS
jgi:hypothetical protein